MEDDSGKRKRWRLTLGWSGLPLDRQLLNVTLLAYMVLIAVMFIPLVGLVVFIPFYCVRLLWTYTGVALVAVVLPVAFGVARWRGRRLLGALMCAIRCSSIAVGILGITLWFTVLSGPGYVPFTAGYWLHMKVWLNVREVRDWASQRTLPSRRFQSIPHSEWPASLKRAVSWPGALYMDTDSRTLQVVEGGGFGHWGIKIGPTAEAERTGFGYYLELEPGAWVWHELQ